ncbi:hydroxysqualene dehydroxylase HpnE [Telmatospirillum sp.]|uniref:hydroxysqualene dehydroxylase HpnE n=1 Tax=Telmatospirillum sp. TaxID=2079197 RepID=UPI0028444182|nr:hydroxysqualene dehydroxylase HpnE [Telmatospirillum sp.]MDR3436075.1 hydroxysqualene dehydroxylase HpnE [Telmatospirillum sp.]
MTLHVVGAGLAGLSCALGAVDAGLDVVLHESAGQAGGRCRSWHEPSIGETIDNGTHMVLGGNRALFAYLRRIGAADRLTPAPIAFPMVDLKTNERWTATPLHLFPSLVASTWQIQHEADTDIARLLGASRNYRRFWEPIALAVMNTPAEDASAHVFRRVLARTLWRGLAASRPYVVRHSLSDTFVTPALSSLAATGADLRFTHPLRRLVVSGQRVRELAFDDQTIQLGQNDQVVLALPWAVAAGLLPDLPKLPASPIVNAHFRLSVPPSKLPAGGFVGLLGGTAQWLFVRGNILSVTVSAAGDLAERSVEELRQILWNDVSKALELKDLPVASRIIKEKRATIYHTPAVEAVRPGVRAGDNLFLAGDWTATGLPCTLEGAIHSGVVAARTLTDAQNTR